MKKKLTVKEIVCGGMFTALAAVGAFIQVPVPGMDYFTLQFLFVLLAGMALGSKMGAVRLMPASRSILGIAAGEPGKEAL